MPIRHQLLVAIAALSSFWMIAWPGVTVAADAATAAGDKRSRPKICLVLSGGGARGAAHVGVLKVLEEYRVPVDCIAGTSMGSLVGAAYASGMSVADMEEINKTITTELLFKENPPRQERSMRRKQDDYGLFVGPELGIGPGGITIAKGIVTGVQLETVLRQLSRVKGYHEFDKLPIQFRAVATDLVTGKPVIFDRGELANVMRASMSVPGAVAPAEFDGMMLVDGMLTQNLPVETARSLNPDIIIAVNVGTPLLKREELNGILGVTSQMLSILTEQNVQNSIAGLKPGDILITPDLSDFSTGDFDNLPKIVPLGEAAARKVADQLAKLSLPPDQYAELRRRQTVEVVADLRPVDEIRFSPMRSVNPESIRPVMRTEAGKPVDQSVLDRDMRAIYGTGFFEHVKYRFLEEPGRRVLVVDAIEKTWGLDALRFGLGLSSDFKGDAYFNLIGSYRDYWINSLGGEWRTDVQVGRTNTISTELYQPLTARGMFFVAPYAQWSRRTSDVYRDDERIATYDISELAAGVSLGAVLGSYGEVRVGIERSRLKPELDTGPAALSPGEDRITQGAATFRLVLDRIDSVHFPRSGWRSGASVYKAASQLGSDNEYTKWDTDGIGAYSWGPHTFNLAFKLGGKIGSDPLPRYDLFQWGGFLQQSGYATGQLIGEKLKFGRVMYYHRILRGTILEGAYGGASLEFGKVSRPLVAGSPTDWLRSVSLFVAADSPIGPMYLGHGWGESGNRSWYFYLGRAF
jgi:NTE family protein